MGPTNLHVGIIMISTSKRSIRIEAAGWFTENSEASHPPSITVSVSHSFVLLLPVNQFVLAEFSGFLPAFNMAARYIIPSVLGSFAISYWAYVLIADKKIFGGTTPRTVASKEWWEETDKKFQAWPRTAGPPVVMNPISRQNFIVKSTDD